MPSRDALRPGVCVYGPYLRKDGRKHVILYDGKNRQTVSYPKWLMEQRLGRFLSSDETVDHDDRDHTNDEPSNLIVRDRGIHASLDALRACPVVQHCRTCGKELMRLRRNVRGNAKKGSAGPFCRHCAAVYRRAVQLNRITPLPAQASVALVHYHVEKD